MKQPLLKSVPLAGLAIALGGLLSSCIVTEPIVSEPPPPTGTITTYRAGYETPTLPPGYRSERIGDTEYYTSNGNYYRSRGSGYIVVDAPHSRPGMGEEVRVTTLPSGYRVVTRSGTRYYQVNDTYYQRRGDAYVVVRSPF